MYTNVLFVYSVLFFVCLLCNINFLSDIEQTTKSPMLTIIMNFPQIKFLTGTILMTS